MRKKYSEKYKIAVCKEFLSRKQTIDSFCKERKIYASMIRRWCQKYKAIVSPFKELRVSRAVKAEILPERDPIQVVLSNGTKINLPPHFCPESLKITLNQLGYVHA